MYEDRYTYIFIMLELIVDLQNHHLQVDRIAQLFEQCTDIAEVRVGSYIEHSKLFKFDSLFEEFNLQKG